MFQFRRFPTYTYLIQCTLLRYCRSGFPHSEIHGSMRMCRSPWLIAACHVLLRLLMPRHSPCALCSLTSSDLGSCYRVPASGNALCIRQNLPLRLEPASLGFKSGLGSCYRVPASGNALCIRQNLPLRLEPASLGFKSGL